ncbi:MAG: MlaD family protein [Candidatus Loosdrechtia sp.]|uniref:MlaD family protein n=1 Tax=Candidatus Loosdrechtia sp. TaxID=3101272 RepID=UPI003A666058|nr:MAG: MlaD family protein [Candidatus Jettenia sp. AMX2]
MTKEQFAELRAGLFILVTLTGFAAMIFILGSQKGYFKPHTTIKTKFLNVYGLQTGAPVRLMGVGIGQVTSITLPRHATDTEIEVSLRIDKFAQRNITRDSVATIKWLSYVTGDTYVEITTGVDWESIVEDGDIIKSAEPINYTAAIESSISTIESLSNIFKSLHEGKFIESLNNISASLDEGLKMFQKGDGLLYALLYDLKSKQLLDNLVATTESLKKITSDIEKGEGTLGALIADPAVYENLVSLLGGAERSFILRSLIRKSIVRGKSP